jgi:acyl carrier protein
MIEENIKSTVRQFINERFLEGMPSQSFNNDESLFAKHIIDSTGVLELALFIEETYGFEVADEDLVPDNLDSVDKLDRYIKMKLNNHN